MHSYSWSLIVDSDASRLLPSRIMVLISHAVVVITVIEALRISVSDAKPKYIALLPNGAKVNGSKALGHVRANGTGAINTFGKDFIFAARSWTVRLCMTDSDGDGQTNGQELGDPCCEWSVGSTPRYSDGLAHPGDKTQKADPSRWLNISCPTEGPATTDPTDIYTSWAAREQRASVLLTIATVLIALALMSFSG